MGPGLPSMPSTPDGVQRHLDVMRSAGGAAPQTAPPVGLWQQVLPQQGMALPTPLPPAGAPVAYGPPASTAPPAEGIPRLAASPVIPPIANPFSMPNQSNVGTPPMFSYGSQTAGGTAQGEAQAPEVEGAQGAQQGPVWIQMTPPNLQGPGFLTGAHGFGFGQGVQPMRLSQPPEQRLLYVETDVERLTPGLRISRGSSPADAIVSTGTLGPSC